MFKFKKTCRTRLDISRKMSCIFCLSWLCCCRCLYSFYHSKVISVTRVADTKRQSRNANKNVCGMKVLPRAVAAAAIAAAISELQREWNGFLWLYNFKVISSKLQKLITTCNKVVLFVNLMKMLCKQRAVCCVHCAQVATISCFLCLIRDCDYHCNYIPRQLIANFTSFEYINIGVCGMVQLDEDPRITEEYPQSNSIGLFIIN